MDLFVYLVLSKRYTFSQRDLISAMVTDRILNVSGIHSVLKSIHSKMTYDKQMWS